MKDKPLTNLEKIREAEKIGYMAILDNEYVFIGREEDFNNDYAWHFRNIKTGSFMLNCMESANELWGLEKITGYLYAGELAGNEPIKEGQKFRVKRLGNIWTATGKDSWSDTHVELKLKNNVEDFCKTEIEPIF